MRHARIEPMTQISMWYHKLMYQAIYKHPMQPMPGKIFMRCDKFLPIEPPPVMKMPGRPKTKRIRSQNEPRKASSDYKLSRKGQRISCAKCHQVGHNKKSCTQVYALSLLILLSFYTCISELVVGINDFL